MSTAPDIKTRPTALILSFLALILVVPLLAYSVIQLEGPRIQRKALADLTAIGQLKANQIEAWLTERRGDAEVLMASEGFIDNVERSLGQHDPLAEQRIASRVAALGRAYGYHRVELLDAHTRPDMAPDRQALLEAALANGRPELSDLYRDEAGQIWLDLLVPLLKPEHGEQRPAGVVVLRTLASAFLFPLIQTWPTPSPSAETLIFRRDGDSILFLNELRHRKGTALTLRLPLDAPDQPVAIAARTGEKPQTIEGRDYRGVPSLASVRPVRGTSWLLVAKVDRDEVMRPLYKLVAWVSAVATTSILAVALTLLLLWRQQQRSHRLELLARTGERDRLLSLFYDLPFMGMAIVDPDDGQWLHANDRLCEILGYGHEELLASTTWTQLTHPDDLAGCLAEYRRMLAGETDGYRMEQRFLRKDGTPVEIDLAVRCVRLPDGKPEYVVKTIRDVSERKRLAEARAEQQRTSGLLEAIAAASKDAIFAKAPDGSYLFCNEAVARDVNRPPREVLGKDDTSLFPPDEAARIMAQDRKILAGGEPRTFEEVLPTADGERTFLTTKGPLLDGDGRTIGLYGISRDITERKFAENRLRRNQEQLQLFIEHAPISIAMFDRRMNYLAYSRRWLEDYGGVYRSLSGRNHYVVHPDLPEKWRAIHRRSLAGETLENEADHWIRADGSERWLRWAVLPWMGVAGAVGGIIISAEDITERKSAEVALADSRARLSAIIDSAMDAIVSLDAGQRVRIFNPAAERMFGYQAAEMTGESIDRLIPERLRERHRQHMQRFAEEGVTSRSLTSQDGFHALRRDGTEFPIEASISKASVAGEQFFTMILRDVSERRQAEEALRFQLDLTRSITEKATDSIFINDASGRVTAFNPEAEKTFGYTAEELVGQVLHDVIHHHHSDGRPFPMSECPLCHIYTNGEMIRDHEATLIRKDGTRLITTGSNAVLESGGKMVGAALILHDITALKRTELALREREEDLNRAQAVGHIGSWRLDVRRNELTWSEENHRIFGVAEGKSLTYEFFLSCVHPDDRAYVDRMWQAALRGEAYDIEHRLLVDGKVKWVMEKAVLEFDPAGHPLGGFGITQDITDIKAAEQALRDSEERFQLATEIGRSGTWDWNVRNGEVIWSRGHYDILGYRTGEVAPGYQSWIERVHPEDRAQIEADIRRCMQERIDYVAEFRVVWPDGSVHWMSARGRYEYGEDGACQRMLGVMADITDLKQAELALREADQRKDEFLAMLAHELRNPLAPIRNAAHVLGRLELDEPRVRWAQDIIERQVTHLTHLVDELLDVSRIARGKVSLKKARIELADLLRQACESVQPLLSAKGHRLEVQMPETGVMLEGDLVRLIQVLQNLLNNAAKYTPDGGHIKLVGRRRGQEVEIQVRDNGMGISADLLPGIFDLFRQGERTLDRSQGGLGIGLTLVHRLVELHGGRVEAYSAGPGLGATFTVRLPAADHAAGEPLHADGRPSTDPARLRVLVVDDDPAVAESMVVFLELEGHQVRSADSGEAALRLLPEFQPQVVLLDIGLPGQDGYQVARRIRQMPGGEALKLVAVSGYGHEEAMELSRQAGFDEHLVKPVDPERLGALLAEIGAQE